MQVKTMLKWVGIVGTLAFAACAPTGPQSDCVMNPDQNVVGCSPTPAEPPTRIRVITP